jgi:hypothetical protein
VPVLAVPARALQLALHAAQHGALEAKPLEDLARAAYARRAWSLGRSVPAVARGARRALRSTRP